jgi:hypothetical protein
MGDKNIKNKTLESGIRDAAFAIRGAMVTPEYKHSILSLTFAYQVDPIGEGVTTQHAS